jgi:hypothetical protein
MGVGPREWSEVNTKAATTEGFVMNTLRRIPRIFAKTFAAVAVVAAVGIPAASMAGAVTAPTLTCASDYSNTYCPVYIVAGQGGSDQIEFYGSNFANDQAIGGNVTLTTTAPGVTFSNVNETGTGSGTADLSVSSSTPTGFFPLTLTDSNGSSTMAVGLGVDVGPQVTATTGNVTTVGGTTTVTLTGSGLRDTYITFSGTGTPPTTPCCETTWNTLGTSATFTVNTSGATPGTWSMIVNNFYPSLGNLNGTFLDTYTVNSAATPVTITAISPSELGIPAGPASSTVSVTLTGTGFESGAVVQLPAPSAGLTLNSSTFVNSSTMTFSVTVAPGATIAQDDVKILNPDTTTATGTGILGIGEAAAAVGPAAPVPPVVNWVSGQLTPGTSSIVFVQGSSTFPITTGSTVSVTFGGLTNQSEILSGTVLSVDSTNTARVQVLVPRFAITGTTAANLAAATTINVADTSGAPAGPSTLTIVDGTSTQILSYTAKTATSFTGVTAVGGVLAHPSGSIVEWLFPTTTGAVMSVNNGTNTEMTAPVIHINAAPLATYTVNGTPVTTLQPGTYAVNAYLAGFGFKTGSTVTFNKDNVTGTVAVVNGNVATLNVTVPSVRTVTLAGVLASPATPGQNALTLTSTTGISVGDKITVNADPFYLTPETFTVTSLPGGGVVGVTPAVADNHSAGATLQDLSAPQSTSDSVDAIITNGNGEAVYVVGFFGFNPPVTATPSLGSVGNPIGAGATSAPEDFVLSGAGTGDSTAANWSFTSSIPGATFVATSVPDANDIDGTISIPAGTPPTAGATFSLTDGLQTITGTLNTVAGPTITSVTTVGNLTAGSSETVGIAGTNFVGSMHCTTSDNTDVPCAMVPQGTDSATIRTVTVGPVGAAALNGTDSISVTNTTTFGEGTLTIGFMVSGQPTYTGVSPTTITQFTDPTITVTGTLIPGTLTVCNEFYTTPAGNTFSNGTCTATPVSATSATITGYDGDPAPGDTITFVVGNATSVATTPGVLVQAIPAASEMYVNSVFYDGTLQAYTDQGVAQGSANVPFKFVGIGFYAGDMFTAGTTLSIPAADGTLTITSITPHAIFGTMNILSTATPGGVTATVTNPGGGSDSLGNAFYVYSGPFVSTVTPPTMLNGSPTTITLVGDGFFPGAVVTSNTAGLATFGTATVTEGSAACTSHCDTLKVTVTPVGFTGNVPIMDGLTITNPTGAGSVSVANAISIDPTPIVTGTYNVPTFSNNVEITVTGSGFQAGMVCTATNSPAYTVLLVNVNATGTAATFLVTTTSAATVGTFTTVTCTNPDGGATSFPLNGGPVAAPQLHVSGISGRPAHIGKSTIFTITGSNLAHATVTVSGHRGVTVFKRRNTSTIITVRVAVAKGQTGGTARLHITNSNGTATLSFSIKR